MKQSPSLHQILEKKQALISQQYKKSLQSKTLMQHYQAIQLKKMYDQRAKLDQKIQEMQHSKNQNLRHMYDMQMKKQMKEERKNQYSKEYDQMIISRKIKQQQQKQQQLWLQKKLLSQESWVRDHFQQKQIQKQKKIQYGKQLQNHLKLQQNKRIEQAIRIKQQRERLKQQTSGISNRGESFDFQKKYTKNSKYQHRLNELPGVKDALNWSQTEQHSNSYQANNTVPITPRMDRMLKVQHQRQFGKGLHNQYKSESEKRYFQKQNPEQMGSFSPEKIPDYNPITNPIPYKYKNPNVLRFIANLS